MAPPDDFMPDEMAEIMARHSLPTDLLPAPCNVAQMRRGGDIVPFDVGAGPDIQPTAGTLAAAFAALELSVDAVTHACSATATPIVSAAC